MAAPALVALAHGSRDPRSARTIKTLVDTVRSMRPDLKVEAAFLELCLETRQPFVVDNTNPTPAERRRYVEPARAAGFRVIGYLVEGDGRSEHVGPGIAAATGRRFVRPAPEEGFDELWHAVPAPGAGGSSRW